MNKLRIRAIALGLQTGAIAEEGLGYNQIAYSASTHPDKTGRHCQTTACIGGHALAMYAPDDWQAYQDGLLHGVVFRHARDILDLDEPTAMQLFNAVPRGFKRGQQPTANKAAAVLYKLAETGVVDWSAKALPTLK